MLSAFCVAGTSLISNTKEMLSQKQQSICKYLAVEFPNLSLSHTIRSWIRKMLQVVSEQHFKIEMEVLEK